ncbi:MAG: ChpI protein [Anaerolineales bacterium]|nr:ChpI protein [Anaerolineales bacterium]
MKTDISIPNLVYQAAEKLAKELGISLSELYTAALTSYVAEHQHRQVAETSDVVYATESPALESDLVEMQILAEFDAWDAASDEALVNFERGLEKQ